jgi:hypothetical protein
VIDYKNKNSLIVPIYINEKIVIDMLAIIDDGFSKVSQINSVENIDKNEKNAVEVGVSTSSIISKFLKIDFRGDIANQKTTQRNNSMSKEKVHTNVSLLSKFRSYIFENEILKINFDIGKLKIGDFIEFEGELQKNPLIEFLNAFVDIYKLVDIFSEESHLGNKSKAKTQEKVNQKIIKQIKSFSDELKHSGTIDFILSSEQGDIVLSTQEQYLSNDNISEILGGTFKVLGKVIAICEDDSNNINLLRKTTLSLLPEELLEEVFAGFKSDEMEQFNLPEFKTKIKGPAMIVIPIAIYS